MLTEGQITLREVLRLPDLQRFFFKNMGLVCDAVSVIYGTPRAADPIYRVLDEETEKIDPKWREHNKERWAARPADIYAKNDNLIKTSISIRK